MPAFAVDLDPHIHAPFTGDREYVVHTARFHIEGTETAFRFFGEHLIGPGSYMGRFLISDKDNLERMVLVSQIRQDLDDI